MSGKNKIDKIFQEDEMVFYTKPIIFNREQLLKKVGLFFLKDIVEILDLRYRDVTRRAKAINAQGGSAWKEMGARKLWNHWIVKMTIFGPYYRKKLRSTIQNIPKTLPRRDLLKQTGIFKMSAVCSHLRFPPQIIRYRVRKDRNAKRHIGVWKDKSSGLYLIDMELFSKWLESYYFNDPSRFPSSAIGLFEWS